MIRLGSLAGYPFDGPRVLAGWTPPAAPGVYVILVRPAPEAAPDRYAVIYAGHGEDLSAEGFPFRHPAAPCWVRRAGSRYAVHVATYQVPGGGEGHRQQICDELVSVYAPQCNDRQVDSSWREEWIGRVPGQPGGS